MDPRSISINDYIYFLPEDRIAVFPLADRVSSKLLVYSRGNITHSFFKNIISSLPANALLIFNDTKVIHARIRLVTETGSPVECFCLEPNHIFSLEDVFSTTGPIRWKCMIGNAKKWKADVLYKRISGVKGETLISFRKISRDGRDFIIEFSWDNSSYNFSEILEYAGELPVPPYLGRDARPEDEVCYNTVFARREGSVAAPTAGLHFSNELVEEIIKSGLHTEKVTLHVGAGTFRQVRTLTMADHEMHEERISIKKEVLQKLMAANGTRQVIAVGTTSARTLESLYWLGVKLYRRERVGLIFQIEQWFPYNPDEDSLPALSKAFAMVLEWMEETNQEEITGYTQIIITPGYTFRVINGLITNFHQPGSTLLLLVAAFVGDKWKDIYTYALENDFRFLSYGDACLLFEDQG